MTKDVLLILSIYEGRGLCPTKGQSLLLEAKLNDLVLSTDVIPLICTPKFNTDLSWQAKKETIRNFKLNRIPIKIECFAINEKREKKTLGYIVIPLTTAVEGVKVDPKWHKLLGGSSVNRQSHPSILLGLSLNTMTLDQHSQMNGKHLHSSMKRSFSIETNKSLVNESSNGSISSTARTGPSNGMSAVQNGTNGRGSENTSNAGDSIRDDDGSLLGMEDLDSAEEEYYEGLEEEELSQEEMEDDQFSHEADEEVGREFDDCSNELPNVSDNTANNDGIEPVTSHQNIAQEILNETTSKRKERESLCQQLNKTVEDERLNSTLPNATKPSTIEHKVSTISDSLGTSRSSIPLISSILKGNSTFPKKNDLSTSLSESPRTLNNSRLTSAAQILSRSLDKSSHNKTGEVHNSSNSPKTFDSSKIKGVGHRKMIPYLNEKKGFFQIGQPCVEEEEFNFSVTIIYAENLKEVVSKDRISTQNFQFCYSLLGCSIYTDPFSNLDNPQFLSEKATATLRATPQNLSTYFVQHPKISIHLVKNELSLANSEIDLSKFTEIKEKSSLSLEGIFKLSSADSSLDIPSSNNSKIAVVFELGKAWMNMDDNIFVKKMEVEPTRNESCSSKERIAIDTTVLSDSDSSADSESKAILEKYTRRKPKDRIFNGRKRRRSKREEEELAHQNLEEELESRAADMVEVAAKELEQLKEEQRRIFDMERESYKRKIDLVEMEFTNRLEEFNKLQEQLSQSMQTLTVREENIDAKEARVLQYEKEINEEKEKLRKNQTSNSTDKVQETLQEQVQFERNLKDRLRQQVIHLESQLAISEKSLKDQIQENMNLRKQIITGKEFVSVAKDNETLMTKLVSVQERKNYYKSQWMSSIEELHNVHLMHKKKLDEFTSSDSFRKQLSSRSPRDASVFGAIDSQSASTLKKLYDERRLLLRLYNPDHILVKKIDSKIAAVVKETKTRI